MTEQIAHSVTLSSLTPSTTWHFRIATTSNNGVTVYSTDNTFKTPGKIDILIASPTDGATINGNSVTVTGSVSNAAGVETGITINGMAAALYNNQFTVNSVPLTSGPNTITVTATDVKGATATKSITVNAEVPANFIKLSAYPESGVQPMNVFFVVSQQLSNPIVNYQIDFDGDGVIDYEGPVFNNVNFTYTTEGIYHPGLTVTDSAGNIYTGSTTVTVQFRSRLEILLKTKWEAMKAALQAGDVDTAISYIIAGNQSQYKAIFAGMDSATINQIFSGISTIEVAKVYGNVASCGAIRNETRGVYSYPLVFVQDPNGIWKILEF